MDARARRTRRGPAGRCVPKSYTTAANKLSSGLFGRRMRHGAAEENDHGSAAFEAAMIVQLTAVGRTKIDIAFRCNIFHAQNMRCAVMHVSVYLCATPHPMPGVRKQQCRQQGLSKCEPRLSFRVIDFSPPTFPFPLLAAFLLLFIIFLISGSLLPSSLPSDEAPRLLASSSSRDDA